MIQSRFDLSEIARQGLDVGAILIAKRRLRDLAVARTRHAPPQPATDQPRAASDSMAPHGAPRPEEQRVQAAVEHLEKTFVRPILEAPDGKAAFEVARALAPGFLPVMFEFFEDIFAWLSADPDERAEFFSALEDLSSKVATGDAAGEGEPGVEDAKRCVAVLSRLLGIIRWAEKSKPDAESLGQLLGLMSLSDLVGFVVIVGADDPEFRSRPPFAMLARTAWELLVERYVRTHAVVFKGLPPGERAEYDKIVTASALARSESLIESGIPVRIERAVAWLVGDPLVGEYYEGVLRLAMKIFPDAALVLEPLDDPESVEGTRPILRLELMPGEAPEAVLERRARLRSEVRTALPTGMASRLSVDIRLGT